ncbi:HlyC/CorC family transporter [bacterium]|nr:HlyC/CorC family transporter [bacterium]
MLFVVSCSAFFSSAETAMISTRRVKLEVWVRRGVRGAKQALQFLHKPERLLTTILVGNNIANVAAASLIAVYLEAHFNGFIITAISSLFLLLFAEFFPKTFSRDRATTFIIKATFLIRGFYYLLYPFTWTVMTFSQFLLKLIGLQSGHVKGFFTRKDLEMLVREGEEWGLVNRDERNLISRLILCGNQKVREIMIPRTEMVVVKVNDPVSKALTIFQKTGYSRLPVTGKSVDEIQGMITVRDILLEEPKKIREIMRDVLFVPETRIIASLLREMKRKHLWVAIAVDEYGGTAGLVTLEDLVEEFLGDIQDEFDEELRLYRKITPRYIDVNARVEIEELNKRFKFSFPEGEYQTLGGLLMGSLGHIPKRKEKWETPTCYCVVLSASRKKVNWVRIIRKKLIEQN